MQENQFSNLSYVPQYLSRVQRSVSNLCGRGRSVYGIQAKMPSFHHAPKDN